VRRRFSTVEREPRERLLEQQPLLDAKFLFQADGCGVGVEDSAILEDHNIRVGDRVGNAGDRASLRTVLQRNRNSNNQKAEHQHTCGPRNKQVPSRKEKFFVIKDWRVWKSPPVMT
jgi:hypothetical protein